MQTFGWKHFYRVDKSCWRRRGNSAVEYAIVLGLIAIACVGSLQVLGQNVRQVLGRASDALVAGGRGPAVPSPHGTEVFAPAEVKISAPVGSPNASEPVAAPAPSPTPVLRDK